MDNIVISSQSIIKKSNKLYLIIKSITKYNWGIVRFEMVILGYYLVNYFFLI